MKNNNNNNNNKIFSFTAAFVLPLYSFGKA